ncbi:urate oxidase [Sporodiniella umbellata]|nr:urate oxidase [Sporodiniella umbellata]
MAGDSNVYLKHARYGKDLVRVMKVYKDGDVQYCTELTVRLMLEGDIEASYTKGDNSCVVTTAQKSPNVDNIELFGQEITQHVLKQYAHISGAFVDIIKHKWTRMIVDGKPHNHSFLRDGDDIQTASIQHYRQGNQIHVTSGLKDLLVLKTTGSAFHGFYKDQYTVLTETWDRIFSTSVDATWTFTSHSGDVLKSIDYKKIHEVVKQITCDTFAKDDSASVQATLYLMQKQILAKYPQIAEISYKLPNKHYVGVDMSKLNINNAGKNTSVYHPQADPSGLITAIAGRKDSKL